MTREEIEAKWEGMTPRERDAWIATDVMGYERVRGNDSYVRKNNMASFPKMYSSDISAAWEVEARILETYRLSYAMSLAEVVSGKRVNLPDELDDFITECSDNLLALIHATPAQRCKAALLAVLEG
ncbi:BC1872 family protein [Paenibacillus bouchesdurhonensis]|uniref:BC1872 family protein n=1 Tax=Paenibacillus bouchesdurhonensis TaxID=1870990 RepID=UPI000DA61A5D|nr:hypothetical protein [Paenibacillus bouchesdurhonensis]